MLSYHYWEDDKMKKTQKQLIRTLHDTATVIKAFQRRYRVGTPEEQKELLRFEAMYLADRANSLLEIARYLDAVADFK